MARSEPARRQPVPDLYRRILYDPRLEIEAFRHLSELDVAGCRRALRSLVDRLELARGVDQPRQIVQLLLDILQRLNRRLHRGPGEEAVYQANRVELIQRFADCEQLETARQRYLGAVDQLLADLGPPPRLARPLVERAKRFIDDSYWRRISLSTVSGALHISPNYLSRIFRLETGMTLTAYIHRVRLEHATLLLAARGQSISEIAYRVGYQNYRDFYRNFVKYENTSPGRYRRRLAARTAPPA